MADVIKDLSGKAVYIIEGDFFKKSFRNITCSLQFKSLFASVSVFVIFCCPGFLDLLRLGFLKVMRNVHFISVNNLALRRLTLSHNKISSVPPNIADLVNLEVVL